MPELEKFTLDLDLEFKVSVLWDGLVGARDLVRQDYNLYNISASNNSDVDFPGCTLTVKLQEHGSSRTSTPIHWTQKAPVLVPTLSPNEKWESEELYVFPIIDGLFIVEISGRIEQDEKSSTAPSLELQGFRGSGSDRLSFYYNVVPREILDLHKTIKSQGK